MAELLGNEQEKNAGRRGNGLFEAILHLEVLRKTITYLSPDTLFP
jgi:hypothetical protein